LLSVTTLKFLISCEMQLFQQGYEFTAVCTSVC